MQSKFLCLWAATYCNTRYIFLTYKCPTSCKIFCIVDSTFVRQYVLLNLDWEQVPLKFYSPQFQRMVPLDMQLAWMNTSHPTQVNIFVRSFPDSKEIFGLSTHSSIRDGTNRCILHFRCHFPLVWCQCHQQQDWETGVVHLQNWIMLAT